MPLKKFHIQIYQFASSITPWNLVMTHENVDDIVQMFLLPDTEPILPFRTSMNKVI